ncbi:hypothetical protein D3C87_1446080 [compost metagenome]
MLYAFAQQRVGHRRAGATGTHLYDTLNGNALQAPAKSLGKAKAIGVVADAFAVLQHHGIHRTNAACFRRQLVEQRDDRLLAREGDVQPGEVHALGGAQQVGQGSAVELQLIEIDQAIEVAQTLGIAFMLV